MDGTGPAPGLYELAPVGQTPATRAPLAAVFSPFATRARLQLMAGQARYSRGWDIQRSARVRVLDRRGARARATVEGGTRPYLVDIAVSETTQQLVGTCSCPDFEGGSGGLCKHQVAVVLELATAERESLKHARAAGFRAPAELPPPYAPPPGAYWIVGEAGRPTTDAAGELALATGVPVRWHAHHADGSFYVWAETNAPASFATVPTLAGDLARHPHAAAADTVAGMLLDCGVQEGRPVELVIDIADGTLEQRCVVPAIALTASRAAIASGAFVADDRLELADDAFLLAVMALREIDTRRPARLHNADHTRVDAAIATLWVPSGASNDPTPARLRALFGRAAEYVLTTRQHLVSDYAALVVVSAPPEFHAEAPVGGTIPAQGWTVQVVVVDPDGRRYAVDDPELATDSPAARAALPALRSAVRRASRHLYTPIDALLAGPAVVDVPRVLQIAAKAKAIEAAGLRLQVPAGLPRPVQFSASVSIAEGPRRFGLDAVCDFAWRVRADGTDLTPEDLDAIRSAKSRIVAVDGRWITASASDLAALRSLLSTSTAADALRLHAGVAEVEGIELEDVELHGWVERLASLDERVEPIDPPAGLTAPLYPHQREALSWMAFLDRCGIGGLLADDMGLGKTVSMLALLQHNKEHDDAGVNLAVVPTTMVAVWAAEAQKYTPDLNVYVHHGSDRARGRDLYLAIRDADLVITNYDTLVRDREDLEVVEWRRVIADEAQAAKNPRSRPRWRCARCGLAKRCA